MSFWRRLFGTKSRETLRPQRLDYLNEGLALERKGDYEAALTSYRLAFRDNPSDSRILLNMAIAFTKTGQPEEAIRHYKRALELDDNPAMRRREERLPHRRGRAERPDRLAAPDRSGRTGWGPACR